MKKKLPSIMLVIAIIAVLSFLGQRAISEQPTTIAKLLNDIRTTNPKYGSLAELYGLSTNIAAAELRDHTLRACGAGMLLVGINQFYLDNIRNRISNIKDFENSLYVQCPTCKGTGQLPVKCPRCNGSGHCPSPMCKSGQVEYKGFNGSVSYGTCSICGGTGKCPQCQGSGETKATCRGCKGQGNVYSINQVGVVYKMEIDQALACLHPVQEVKTGSTVESGVATSSLDIASSKTESVPYMAAGNTADNIQAMPVEPPALPQPLEHAGITNLSPQTGLTEPVQGRSPKIMPDVKEVDSPAPDDNTAKKAPTFHKEKEAFQSPIVTTAPSDRLSELKKQLKQLDAEKQQKLNSVESDFNEELRNLDKDIGILKQSLSTAQQKLATIKAQHDPLAAQLHALQTQRDAIQEKYEKQISDAELQVRNTIAARDKYKTEMLAATAKLINDAIIANNLKINIVPKDGIYKSKPGQPTEEDIPELWPSKTYHSYEIHCVGTVFEYQPFLDILGPGEKQPIVGDVLKMHWVEFFVEEGAGITMAARIERDIYNTRIHKVTFLRIPTALANTVTAKTFFSWCMSYINQLAAYKRACDPKLIDTLKEEYKLALQKWDYQNADRLESLKQQILPMAKRIKTANQELSGFNMDLAQKTSLIGTPRSEVLAEKRDKITTTFEERKGMLMKEIAFAQAAVVAARHAKLQKILGTLKTILIIGLVIIGVIFAWGLSKKCPSCKRMWAARVLDRVVTGEEEEWSQETKTTRHYDSRGQETGRSETPYQQRYIRTYYKDYCQCKHCGHEWVKNGSYSTKA